MTCKKHIAALASVVFFTGAVLAPALSYAFTDLSVYPEVTPYTLSYQLSPSDAATCLADEPGATNWYLVVGELYTEFGPSYVFATSTTFGDPDGDSISYSFTAASWVPVAAIAPNTVGYVELTCGYVGHENDFNGFYAELSTQGSTPVSQVPFNINDSLGGGSGTSTEATSTPNQVQSDWLGAWVVYFASAVFAVWLLRRRH